MIDVVTPPKQNLYHIVESATGGADDRQVVKHPFLPGDFDGGFGDWPGAEGRPRGGFFGIFGFQRDFFDWFRLRRGFGYALLALEKALKELAKVEFGLFFGIRWVFRHNFRDYSGIPVRLPPILAAIVSP